MNIASSKSAIDPKQQETAAHLRADVETICFPEGRVVGTAGHARAEEILSRRLAEIGCRPYRGGEFRLLYRHGSQGFVNLVGVIPGNGDRTLPPVLVGAHYDSVIPAPCADDNAAAVALALEAGQAAALVPLERDLVVAIFDAEEPPHFRLCANLAATDLPRGLGMCDPVALEIEHMQAILGPLLPALAGRPGPLRTRGDIRDVVSKMRSTGL